jgi:hypothetical protein
VEAPRVGATLQPTGSLFSAVTDIKPFVFFSNHDIKPFLA